MADTPESNAATMGPSPSSGSTDDLAGRVLGDFELVRRIGAGGMGQVYLARQKSLKRQVAVKILKEELAANTTALRRFQAEAEAIANVTHANIVQVYAVGEADGLHYMALEYVDGRNLRDFLEKKGIPELPLALEIMRQVAAALERAAELGFVHRDIKPENILLSKKGEVKVADFGLSRCFGPDAALNLTQSGVTMGTPLYMSPEQVRGQPVDPRSDIYSFGVTAYHMLGGEPPFRGATAFDVALQHVQSEPRPLRILRPDLPPEVCGLVHRMMAKRPEDRYQSAREVLTDIDRLRGGGATGATFAAALGSASGLGPTAGADWETQSLARSGGAGKWALVAGLALAVAGFGAALHWAQAPRLAAINPDDAAADIDPAPSVVREAELTRLIHDKTVKVDVAIDALLERAEIAIRDRRLDDALKVFDLEAVRKLGAFEAATPRERAQLGVACGLGRGIVLAHQDNADPSNAAFAKVLRDFPPAVKGEVPPKLAGGAFPRGLLEAFFMRSTAGVKWKRAVGEAIDRNATNLGGDVPDELKRLRYLQAKGPPAKG